MKKVIFLAIAAAAALTACSKSEVIDSKYGNDMIGFENYLGRDAQTKASIADIDTLKTSEYAGIGLFGYYTGKDSWKYEGSTLTQGIDNPTANLWANQQLKWGTNPALSTGETWTYTDIRYWTNAVDKYSFLAYAPYNSVTVSQSTNAKDLAITYTCHIAQGGNVDLLYSNNNKNITKGEGGTVPLQFNHALARVTVKAKALGTDFGYDIKEISLTGGFITEGTLNLATGLWNSSDPISTPSTYTIYSDYNSCSSKDVQDETAGTTKKVWDVLGSVYTDYSITTYPSNKTSANKFLMMIPTKFTTENPATLKVVYSTIYADQESDNITKEIKLTNDFQAGMAYSLNIDFTPVLDPIKFSVEVNPWNDANPTSTGNPDDSKDGWAQPTTTPENGEAGA